MSSPVASARPEVVAGGIARDDGEIHFFVRANALLRSDMTVLDFGCGRGAIFNSGEWMLREQLAKLQGKVKKVIGVDVDKSVFEHPFLDERYVLGENEPLPIEAETVDLVVAHWVFEHVTNPAELASEFFRILKTGGWICARTPHRWSYVGFAARVVANRFQTTLLRRIRPGMEEKDKFPTAYKLNSYRQLERYFPKDKWLHVSYGVNSTPRYHFGNRVMFLIISAVQHVLWPKTDLLVLLRKR